MYHVRLNETAFQLLRIKRKLSTTIGTTIKYNVYPCSRIFEFGKLIAFDILKNFSYPRKTDSGKSVSNCVSNCVFSNCEVRVREKAVSIPSLTC